MRRQHQKLHVPVRFKFYVVKIVSHGCLNTPCISRSVSRSRDLVLGRNVKTTPDPPSVPMANAQATPGEAQGMDGHQLVQWLTVQAGDVTGTLQQGVRALLTRAHASA